MDEDPWRAAHRIALDHVLALIAAAPWSEPLVLRGSRVMAAWYGVRAREPADLDFVVEPSRVAPVDVLRRYPYVDSVAQVQFWPEAADGAAGYDLWMDGEEEQDRGGFRPRLAPEGLSWLEYPDPLEYLPPVDDLQVRICAAADAPHGVRLDAQGVLADREWAYAYAPDPYDDVDDDLEGGTVGESPLAGGVRVHVPWHAPGGLAGRVQLDFAHDDRLPEPAVWTLIRSAHRREPVVIRAAGREVSLAWKLLWLHRDAHTGGAPRCKDLYDAVLLAEDPRTDLRPRLLRRVVYDNQLGGLPLLESVCPDEDAWAEFRAGMQGIDGTAARWLERLATALAPHTAPGP